ncbi:hypothetical protein AB0K14_29720 [Actinosynnema sp. NPDC050801]|uniref:hypothetical protein n=1 Tax=unclassified Actinosynnema TaxID=2637065 RepID=UPI0033FC60D4
MRRIAVLVLTGLALAGCAERPADTGSTGPEPATTSTAVPSAPVHPTRLSPHGLDVLKDAERNGASTIGLTVSTEPGRAAEVAAAVQRLGATVETTDPAIGYVRVTAPVGAVAELAGIEGISRVDVDEPLSNGDPTP